MRLKPSGRPLLSLPFQRGGRMMSVNLAVLLPAAFVGLAIAATPILAADFGGGCCADLEERIAELEATTARKGNRKVALTVTGTVHQSILFWDDGGEANVYVVGNANDSDDQTTLQFAGEAAFAPSSTAGFQITIRINNALSSEVSQFNDDLPETPLQLWEAYWFVGSEALGRLTLGQASRASDGAPEADLSGTRHASFSGVQSIGGGLALRRSDGGLTDVVWGDLHSHLNGDTANVVRYDSPEWAGFAVAASYGEDDIWDLAATFDGKVSALEIAAAVAYSRTTDAGGLDSGSANPDAATLVGSLAVLHQPSGLNALVAAGQQRFGSAVADADGIRRTPSDAKFVYAKLGWIANWSSIGPTSFYADYGRFQDYLTAGADAAAVSSLGVRGVCGMAGTCRIESSRSDVWGLGLVQSIDAADMEIHLGYRRQSASFGLSDTTGGAVAARGLQDAQTVVLGTFLQF